MNNNRFTALEVSLTDKGVVRRILRREEQQLPPGEVVISVHYSGLNFKDALSANGNKGVTKHYPHTPGIDAAGIVLASSNPQWSPGDAVIVTGYDLGMNTSGGFAERIRVPASWVVPLPKHLSLRQAMVYGTAGFTAAQAVNRIVTACEPGAGEVVVSGARGGVAGFALAILSKLGYTTVAVTRDPQAGHEQLMALGVSKVISIDDIQEPNKPLLAARWAAGFDTVGGETLASIVKSAAPGAVIACCGNAQSVQLPLSVFPFILRGVTLSGIDSQHCPMPQRLLLWDKLAGEWSVDCPLTIHEVGLEGLEAQIDAMLAGKHSGRTLVRIQSNQS